MANRDHVKSVVRALNILECLAESKSGLGITELGLRLDLPKSTIHRLLNTLSHKGYVIQQNKGEGYELGFKILHLYGSLIENTDIRQVARGFMEELVREIGETAHLVIRDGNEVVYIDKVEGLTKGSAIRMASQIGKRSYMHSTAVGKVLLSDLEWADIEIILTEAGMPKFTEQTITNINMFKEHIKEVKENGWAMDDIENEEGIRCIAAPLRDYTGKIVAAISISGPSVRVTKEKAVQKLKPLILSTSKRISKHLGFVETESVDRNK